MVQPPNAEGPRQRSRQPHRGVIRVAVRSGSLTPYVDVFEARAGGAPQLEEALHAILQAMAKLVTQDAPAELVAALPNGTMAAGHRAGERLARWLEGVVAAGGLAPSLTAAGIAAPDLGFLAAAAASQWTAGFNPRPVSVDDLAKLYKEAR